MDYVIIAKGLDGKLYHLFVYNYDVDKMVFKWFSEYDSPIAYSTYMNVEAALYFIRDKRDKIINAENATKIDINSISVGKINVKVKNLKIKPN